jgi:hypothetical protein
MNSEILIGMCFDVGLFVFASQIAATLPINRKAASLVEQGCTSNFTVLVTHFKMHVATVLLQRDLRLFLRNYS